MNDSDQEPDLFTEALRADLPSDEDEARVRMRLMAAGVLAGASLIVPSTAAAATASGGLLSKLASLPLALKVGASVVVLGVAAVPVIEGLSSDAHGVTTKPVAAAGALVVAKAPAPRTESAANELPVSPAANAVEVSLPAAPLLEPSSPAVPRARSERALVRSAAAAELAPEGLRPSGQDANLPAVGAFPAAQSAAVDEGTLRAETALMERALAALRRNDIATARRELALHAAKFPDGHLKPERERALERTLEKETER